MGKCSSSASSRSSKASRATAHAEVRSAPATGRTRRRTHHRPSDTRPIAPSGNAQSHDRPGRPASWKPGTRACRRSTMTPWVSPAATQLRMSLRHRPALGLGQACSVLPGQNGLMTLRATDVARRDSCASVSAPSARTPGGNATHTARHKHPATPSRTAAMHAGWGREPPRPMRQKVAVRPTGRAYTGTTLAESSAETGR